MSKKSPPQRSRRDTLKGIALAIACGSNWTKSAIAEAPRIDALPAQCGGPILMATGPDAEQYGAAYGYPVPDVALARTQGNPWEPKYRVGAFTHLDEIYATRRVDRATTPWMFRCSSADVRYQFRGGQYSLVDYMSRNPVTGLLLAKDDEILFER